MQVALSGLKQLRETLWKENDLKKSTPPESPEIKVSGIFWRFSFTGGQSINQYQNHLTSIRVNQHQPASISFDEQQLALTSINHYQSASISTSINQQQSVSIRINYHQHQLKSISINNHWWASIRTNKRQYQRDLSIIMNQHQSALASINAYIENVRIALSMKNKICILAKCSVTWHSFLRCEFFMCSD